MDPVQWCTLFVGSKNMELQLFFNLFQMPPRNPGKGCCGGEGAEKEDPVPVTLATLQHWSSTSPPKSQPAPISYVRRARQRQLARLEEERLKVSSPPPKQTYRAWSVEENEEILAVRRNCFCGECV